ncbi:MAG: tRNA epoxyqueuosine(34) reductase QueG [Fimbriimonadaceae bacterium]
MNLQQQVLDFAGGLGFDPVGIAPITPPEHWEAYKEWIESGRHGSMKYLEEHLQLKRTPENLLPRAKSAIVVGLNYYQPQPDLKIARYALGRDYHRVLRAKLKKLVHHIEVSPSLLHEMEAQFRICVDSAPLMERDLAQAAGLGWFGKNTMIINSARGSWFVLGIVLTTLEIEPTKPALGGCGTCRACIDACPTGAIIHDAGRWQVDARSCISYLTIEHKGPFAESQSQQVGEWTFGCDVCQQVCPFNHPRESQPLRARNTVEPGFAPKSFPKLTELAQIGHPEWDELTQGSPIRRARYEGLKRNAQANLRNVTVSQVCQAEERL